MVDVTHDWDDEDYVKTLEDAFAEYRRACYGEHPLPSQQVQEVKQAFMSGIRWLGTRESYCPDDLETALRKVIGQFNSFVNTVSHDD